MQVHCRVLRKPGARHQCEQSIAHIEVEQIAPPRICHQQQAAFVKPPEVLDGQPWSSLVLRQYSQLVELRILDFVLKCLAQVAWYYFASDLTLGHPLGQP